MYFEDAHLEGSGGLLKYRNSNDSFRLSGGLPKYRTPKIPSGGLSSSEERETKIRFGRASWFQRMEKNQDSIGWASEEWKIKIRFRVPKNGKRELRFVRPFSIFRRTKKPRFVRMDFRQTGEPRFVRMGFGQIKESRFVRVDFGQMGELRFVRIRKIGRLPKNENPKIKISSGLSEERKKTKDLVSVFRRTEKTKIRSMGFRVLKNNRKPRFVSGSLKKVEPRFVWCLGWVPMNRKKPKIHQDS
ncbi:unnamed protein product [Rhizophagus irregularis]|nr:unnamed protein product [Rhizophagus irregularis]